MKLCIYCLFVDQVKPQPPSRPLPALATKSVLDNITSHLNHTCHIFALIHFSLLIWNLKNLVSSDHQAEASDASGEAEAEAVCRTRSAASHSAGTYADSPQLPPKSSASKHSRCYPRYSRFWSRLWFWASSQHSSVMSQQWLTVSKHIKVWQTAKTQMCWNNSLPIRRGLEEENCSCAERDSSTVCLFLQLAGRAALMPPSRPRWHITQHVVNTGILWQSPGVIVPPSRTQKILSGDARLFDNGNKIPRRISNVKWQSFFPQSRSLRITAAPSVSGLCRPSARRWKPEDAADKLLCFTNDKWLRCHDDF